MNKGKKITISIGMMFAVMLAGCAPAAVPKSSFGQVDVIQDGEVLVDSVNGKAEDEPSEEEESATSDSPMRTATTLDPADLPYSILQMAGLCDAINMACVEQQKIYAADDNDFVWHCVHLYVCNCTDRSMGFKNIGEYVEADPRIVNNVIYAMFGKIKEVPPLTEAVLNDSDGNEAHIMISNGLTLRFRAGDRGTSKSEVRRATLYSDGSLEMEVALVDDETGEETVSFIYTMRANTKDTTTAALFAYEITGVRAADKLSSDKMNGVPFLTPVIQTYGYDSYDKDDPKYNEVVEVLQFASFKDHVPGMEVINDKIAKEVIAYADSPTDEVSWHEIISYPLTTGDYVQVATTLATYPTYAEDPDIRCYNYDNKKSRIMDINDALSICQMTNAKLNDRVKELWKPEGSQTLTDMEYKGFMVRADGSADIFFMFSISDPEADDQTRLAVYNSGSDSLRYAFEGSGVIPPDETDKMKPELTHGVKDRH